MATRSKTPRDISRELKLNLFKTFHGMKPNQQCEAFLIFLENDKVLDRDKEDVREVLIGKLANFDKWKEERDKWREEQALKEKFNAEWYGPAQYVPVSQPSLSIAASPPTSHLLHPTYPSVGNSGSGVVPGVPMGAPVAFAEGGPPLSGFVNPYSPYSMAPGPTGPSFTTPPPMFATSMNPGSYAACSQVTHSTYSSTSHLNNQGTMFQVKEEPVSDTEEIDCKPTEEERRAWLQMPSTMKTISPPKQIIDVESHTLNQQRKRPSSTEKSSRRYSEPKRKRSSRDRRRERSRSKIEVYLPFYTGDYNEKNYLIDTMDRADFYTGQVLIPYDTLFSRERAILHKMYESFQLPDKCKTCKTEIKFPSDFIRHVLSLAHQEKCLSINGPCFTRDKDFELLKQDIEFAIWRASF